MTTLFLFALPALAGEIEMWAGATFSAGDPIAGSGGWTNGWSRDEWLAVQTGSGIWAVANWDQGEGSEGMGNGDASDNYVVNEAVPVTQGALTVEVYPDGNDAWGIVFGHQARETWLLYLFCGEQDGDPGSALCPPVEGAPEPPYTAIVSVHDGVGEVLEISKKGFNQEQFGNVRVEINDGTIRVSNDTWEDEFTAEAPRGAEMAGVGFYCFEQGYEGGGSAYGPTYFRNPVLNAFDDDDDGVIDDEDNCEKDKNADQADGDGDGIGTACDEDEGGGDADTDTDTDADADADGDTDTDGGVDGKPEKNANAEIEVEGGCGCATGGPGGLGTAAVLACAALFSRRRRHQEKA